MNQEHYDLVKTYLKLTEQSEHCKLRVHYTIVKINELVIILEQSINNNDCALFRETICKLIYESYVLCLLNNDSIVDNNENINNEQINEDCVPHELCELFEHANKDNIIMKLQNYLTYLLIDPQTSEMINFLYDIYEQIFRTKMIKLFYDCHATYINNKLCSNETEANHVIELYEKLVPTKCLTIKCCNGQHVVVDQETNSVVDKFY